LNSPATVILAGGEDKKELLAVKGLERGKLEKRLEKRLEKVGNIEKTMLEKRKK
jgi:hypothetical protein